MIEQLDGTQHKNRYIDVPKNLNGMMSDWLVGSPLIQGDDDVGVVNNQQNDMDLLNMDPNLLTFEQQIRRAELESLREMRENQMRNEQSQNNNNNQNNNQKKISIEGVSDERLNEIISKDPENMTDDEILIYTQYVDKLNESEK